MPSYFGPFSPVHLREGTREHTSPQPRRRRIWTKTFVGWASRCRVVCKNTVARAKARVLGCESAPKFARAMCACRLRVCTWPESSRLLGELHANKVQTRYALPKQHRCARLQAWARCRCRRRHEGCLQMVRSVARGMSSKHKGKK